MFGSVIKYTVERTPLLTTHQISMIIGLFLSYMEEMKLIELLRVLQILVLQYMKEELQSLAVPFSLKVVGLTGT